MGKSVPEKIRESGVVGAGGAGFPTDVKVNTKAEVVIANGAECEPLLRVDQQVMVCHAKEMVNGLRLVMEATQAKSGVIALKDHYEDAIGALRAELSGQKDVTLHIMKSYYPAGDEQQIVYEVIGKVVPTGGLPLDVGAVVSNVSTLVNVSRADSGTPVTEKYVTVGGAVKHPVTLNAPVGASMSRLLELAGGVTCDCDYIVGGPCMGQVITDSDKPVTKTTGGIIALPKGHRLFASKSAAMNLQLVKAVCCQCMMCTIMCPRNALGLHVEPHKAMRSIAHGKDLYGGNLNGIFSCCDCGLCTYSACNFGLKPHKVMAELKAGLARNGVKAKKEVYAGVDGAIGTKRMPVSRLISRLGVSSYDVDAPLDTQVIAVDEVRIPLKMHVGAPSVPVVNEGRRVKKGDLIADIPQGALGAKIHASIDGSVTKVTDSEIWLRS